MAWGCLLAVFAPVGASQPAGDAATQDVKSEIAERIHEAQQQGGPYSEELIDPLTALSLLYVEDGQHALAVSTIDQALQVVRANYGLRSLEQAPLLRQRISSEESRGNFAEAWKLEQDLLTLVGRNLDDVRSASILHELGDKRMELHDRFLDGEWSPQLVLGCYYEGSTASMDSRNCQAGSRYGAARRIVYDAQRNYLNAVKVLLSQRAYSSNELYELEAKVLRNSYGYNGYENGRQSLRRVLSYDVANAAPMTTRIDKLIQLADWDLLFDERPRALELYAQIHEFMEQQGATPQRIDEVFLPDVPIALPTFVSSPFEPELAHGSTGYVDLAFDLTQFGTTRRIDVLDTTSNASDDAQDRLVRWIVQAHFRPQMKDGRLAKATRVVARAYVRE